MIVVDTAVWVDWFRAAQRPHVRRLDRALADGEEVGLAPVILTEVLQGIRDDGVFVSARDTLLRLPLVTLDATGHVAAAALFRTLRRQGITIRGAVDCIIAQTCLAVDAELLSPDRDFVAIARHSRLRLCPV